MRNSGRWAVVFLAILILGVAVAAALTEGFTNADPYGWLSKGKEPETEADGGLVVAPEDETGDGVMLSSVAIAPEEYATYGISTVAQGAQLLTATVKTGGVAIDLDVDWSVAFSKASEWAAGKTVTDYVQVTALADSGLEGRKATVQCLQPFGEVIVITCSVRGDAAKKATANVNYLQRIADTTVMFGDVTCNFDGEAFTPVDFVGTGYQGLAFQGKPLALAYHMECSSAYTLPLDVTCKVEGNSDGFFNQMFKESDTPERYGATYAVFSGKVGAYNHQVSYSEADWSEFDLLAKGLPYSVQFLTENLFRAETGEQTGGAPKYEQYMLSQLLEDYNVFKDKIDKLKHMFTATFTFSCDKAGYEAVTKQTKFCIGKIDVGADSVELDREDLYY